MFAKKENAKKTDRHFEFTKAVHPYDSRLRQIRATRDVQYGRIRKGDVGGWISCVDNLEDEAWVQGDAKVLGCDARLKGNAMVAGEVVISGKSILSGNCLVMETVILEDCTVSEYAVVRGSVSAERSSFAGVSTTNGQNPLMISDSTVKDNAYVKATGFIKRNSVLSRTAVVTGKAEFYGADLGRNGHALNVGPLGSEGCTAVIYRTLDVEGQAGHTLKIGCWTGTVEELGEEVRERRENDWYDATEKEVGIWTAQYAGLEALVRATVKGW